MWFLPMLFWCFVCEWLLEQIKINDGWKMVVLILLNLFNVISLPLRISSAISFMVYFHGGFMVYKYAERIKKRITTKTLFLSWITFATVYTVLRPLTDISIIEGSSISSKVFTVIASHGGQLLYSSIGTLAFYLSAVYYCQRHRLNSFTRRLADCCFGIYIFQQFVLQSLYYKTSFSTFVGPYWLPWCGFLLAIVLSFIVTDLLLTTRIGKTLLG